MAERALEALDLVDAGVVAEVDRPVEDHRAGVLGEGVGVLRPDLGAVGEAQVVQPLVADEPAQQVEVAHGVGGRDVLEQHPGAGQAVPAEALDRGVEGGGLGGVVRRAVEGEEPVEGGVVGAADRRRPADAAGVPAHEVLVLEALAGEAGQQAQPGPARAARVDEQAAEPRRRRRPDAAHHQRERPAVGGGPVERGGDGRRTRPGGCSSTSRAAARCSAPSPEPAGGSMTPGATTAGTGSSGRPSGGVGRDGRRGRARRRRGRLRRTRRSPGAGAAGGRPRAGAARGQEGRRARRPRRSGTRRVAAGRVAGGDGLTRAGRPAAALAVAAGRRFRALLVRLARAADAGPAALADRTAVLHPDEHRVGRHLVARRRRPRRRRSTGTPTAGTSRANSA